MDSLLDDCLREAASFSAPLLEELRGFLRRPGKRVRPLLLAHSYRTFSGREPDAAILRVAAALELMHVFILVHDDVIDRSSTRGGLPTLHRALESRLGVHHGREDAARALAVVFGDILFAIAQRAILRSNLPAETRLRALDAMLAFMIDTGHGECDDVLFGAWDISRIAPADVEHMYWLKTSRYSIECPMVLGAILAGRDHTTTGYLRDISRPLGLAFQIRNDLAAFRQFESSDACIPDDFLEGKKTLLLTTAYEQLGETDRRLLQLCLGQHPVSDAALFTLRDLVAKSGAVATLELRVADLAASGGAILAQVPWAADEIDGLQSAMDFLSGVLECRPRATMAKVAAA